MKKRIPQVHPSIAFERELRQIFGARAANIKRATVYCYPGAPVQPGETRTFSRYFQCSVGIWFDGGVR